MRSAFYFDKRFVCRKDGAAKGGRKNPTRTPETTVTILLTNTLKIFLNVLFFIFPIIPPVTTLSIQFHSLTAVV